MDNLKTIAIIIFFIVLIVVFVNAFIKSRKIKNEGIETDGIISRIDEDVNNDGTWISKEYISYIDENGKQREAIFALQAFKNHKVNDKIRIKYLPGKYEEVVEVKD